jgi:hypothetical protein
VRLSFRHSDSCAFRRRLLFMATLALVFCANATEQARASSLRAAGSPSGAAEYHRHSCRCPDCHDGGSCCCSKTLKSKKTRFSPSPSAATLFGAGPCVKAGPCGDSGHPLLGPSVVVGEAAIFLGFARIDDTSNGVWSFPFSTISLPSGLFARLDDPPEGARSLPL